MSSCLYWELTFGECGNVGFVPTLQNQFLISSGSQAPRRVVVARLSITVRLLREQRLPGLIEILCLLWPFPPGSSGRFSVDPQLLPLGGECFPLASSSLSFHHPTKVPQLWLLIVQKKHFRPFQRPPRELC